MEFNFHVDLRLEEDRRWSAEVTVYGGDKIPQEPIATMKTGAFNHRYQAVERSATLIASHMHYSVEEDQS